MFPAHGRHDGHRAWRGSGTCGAMIPAGGGMTLLDVMGMWKWVCDLVWAGRMCGRLNFTSNTGSRACASDRVCASCGGARRPPYYILQHNHGTSRVLSDRRQLPCRYGFGRNREDRCYFQHGVEAEQWKRVASAMTIRDAETYVWQIRSDGPNTEPYPALNHCSIPVSLPVCKPPPNTRPQHII